MQDEQRLMSMGSLEEEFNTSLEAEGQKAGRRVAKNKVYQEAAKGRS